MYVIITLPAPQHVNNSDRYTNNIYTKARNIIKRSNFTNVIGQFMFLENTMIRMQILIFI